MTNMLIRIGNEPWHEPTMNGYTDEAHLQSILLDHPSLIPGVSAGAKVCKEFQSGIGPADVVAVDLESGLTLVECKLASNPQIRREIIGQILDYASRLWQMSVEDFDAQWVVRTGHSLFADPEESAGLRRLLEESLSAGLFRIVLAVDVINDDLRRIVEYLNSITLPSVAVIAVVYARSQHGDVEVLIHHTYGGELAEAKTSRQQATRPRWTVDEYFEWLRENDQGAIPSAEVLISAFQQGEFEVEGGRATKPSLSVKANLLSLGRKWPVAFYAYEHGATVEVRFEDLMSTPEIAEKYLVAVMEVPGIVVNADEVRRVGYAKRPNFPLRNLSAETARSLVEAIKRSLTQTK